jgi:hypothetical protein
VTLSATSLGETGIFSNPNLLRTQPPDCYPQLNQAGGVTVIQGKALADAERPVTLTAVPCYAWANREKGAMTVWIGEVSGMKPRLAAFVSAAYNDALTVHGGLSRFSRRH